jgi:hypothetical protein
LGNVVVAVTAGARAGLSLAVTALRSKVLSMGALAGARTVSGRVAPVAGRLGATAAPRGTNLTTRIVSVLAGARAEARFRIATGGIAEVYVGGQFVPATPMAYRGGEWVPVEVLRYSSGAWFPLS